VCCGVMVIVDHSNDPAIALQLMWGSYNGQQRPLTSKKDTKYSYRLCSNFIFWKR